MADDKVTDSTGGRTKAAATADDRTDEPSPEATEDQPGEPAPEAANDRGEDNDVADLKSRLLRALADMENLRRRTEREIADARKYAVASFARDMLVVGDNLRRAIDAVPDALREGGDQSVAALIEGVEVTERTLEQTLTKIGVKPIAAKGRKFDPSLHQAMMEVENDDAQPGSVADEIQVGYLIGERVLRPAFVSVVKKRRPTAEATDEDTDEAIDEATDEAMGEATTAPPDAPAENAEKA